MASSSSGEQRTLQLFGRKCAWDEEKLRTAYNRLCKAPSTGLQLPEFSALMSDVFRLTMPASDSLLAQRLFSVFLRSRPDSVSFAELLSAVDVLSSDDPRAKFDLTFRAFDFEDTGFINQQSVATVATELCAHLFRKSPIARVTKALAAVYPSFCLRSQLLGAPEFVRMATESGSQELTVVLSLFSVGATAATADDQPAADTPPTTTTTTTTIAAAATTTTPSRARKGIDSADTSPARSPTAQRRSMAASTPSASRTEKNATTPSTSRTEKSATSPGTSRTDKSAATPSRTDKSAATPSRTDKSAGSKSKSGEQQNDGDEELSEFEQRLVAQIRGLQAELRKKIAQTAEDEATIQALEKANKDLSVKLTETTLRSEQQTQQLSRQLDDAQRQLECLCQWMFEPQLGVDPKEEHFEPPHSSDVVKVGYILKEQDVMKNWKRRLFVLRASGDLYWFTRAEAPKIRGQTNVRTHQLRKRASPDSEVLATALDLVTVDREIHLLFKDAASRDSWSAALQSVRRLPSAPAAAATSSYPL